MPFAPDWQKLLSMNQEKRIRIKVGRRVKEYRQLRGKSQMELALDAELDKSFLGDIELGRANPSIRVVARIADALEIRVYELFADRRYRKSK